MLKKLVRATAVAAAMTTSSFTGATAEPVNFGIISTESTSNLQTTWQPFLDAMENQTGLEIEAFFASDYAGVIEAMRFDKVQVAWFGNKSAMEAVDRSNGEIFAQTVDSEGNPGYWSLIIVNKDSPYQNLEDILACDSSLDFGIGDPNSTSGFLVPTTYIFAERNIDPNECFATVRSAKHEVNAMAVANGQVDAATNNTENMRRLQVTAPEAYAKIRIIWQSPLIPSDPLVWRADLDPTIQAKIYTFVMTYGRSGTQEEVAQAREVLNNLGWAPFRPSSNAQLFPIRQLAINKEVLNIRADDNFSDAEKEVKIAELQRQFDEIAVMMESAPNM